MALFFVIILLVLDHEALAIPDLYFHISSKFVGVDFTDFESITSFLQINLFPDAMQVCLKPEIVETEFILLQVFISILRFAADAFVEEQIKIIDEIKIINRFIQMSQQ